jgi:hypothetical protein
LLGEGAIKPAIAGLIRRAIIPSIDGLTDAPGDQKIRQLTDFRVSRVRIGSALWDRLAIEAVNASNSAGLRARLGALLRRRPADCKSVS